MAAIHTEARFLDNDAARQHLEALRWPDGPICPHCGGVERNSALNGTSHRKGLYFCGDCRQQFTVTVGTVFERSKIPLHKWVYATHLICASKKGMSSKQLERMLDVTYKTAWFMMHRIREAMRLETSGKLTGTVEVDETYVGGKPRAFAAEKPKAIVVALVERQGRVVAHPIERVTAKELKGAIRRNVDRNAIIMTDELRSYQGLHREFREHLTVKHSEKQYAIGPISTNTVEGFFSLLKRGVIGTFHHVSKQHLGRYVDEFSFRWNHRHVSDTERAASALKGISGKRLTYRRPNL